ncbi:MAG: sensor histidine kinase [Acidobacteria bacterium]|nr:MAG: sensor histidine kinase [Acidobacteriota bacterium]
MRIKVSERLAWSYLSPYLTNRPIVVWFAVAIILLSGLSGAGVWYYRHQRETLKKDVWSDLNAIADLKVSQISEWRRSRVAEATILADIASREAALGRLVLTSRRPGGLDPELLRTFRDNTQAERIFLVSREGRVVESAPPGVSQAPQSDLQLLERCFTERKVLFSDFNKDPSEDIHLDLFVPVTDPAKRDQALAVLVLRLDPDDYLYPLIQTWPTPSRTAETLLIRRQGDSVVYLNELRHRKGTALRLSFPLTQQSLPAAHATVGAETTMEGTDYRGVPVLAVTRQIPNSPWALVAKMDQAESYAIAKQMAKVTGFQVFLLVSTLSLAFALLLGQKAIQIRNRERQAKIEYRELAKHSDELQRLAAHLDIREEESRRISREIHEEFGNALVGARFRLLDVHGRVPDDHPELAERIKAVLAEQKSLIDQVRSISQHLRPPILDQLGLIPAIKWLADDFELRTGTKCLVSIQVPDRTKRKRPYASAIYRICQEALSNVARHSGSDGAQVLFSENDAEAVLEVRDNGKGFVFSEGNDSSIGIINMRERARQCGGTLDIITAPGQGTKVTARIPLEKRA